MGTEGLWIPAVASLISGGAQYINSRNQARRQDNILSQQLVAANARQDRADQEVRNLLDRTSRSSMQDEKAGRLEAYLGQLAKALPQAQGGLLRTPGTSDAFQRDAEAAALGIAEAGNTYADRVATIDAGGLQRQGEAVDRNRTATQDLSLIEREQQAADRVADLRLRGVRSNPWLEALAAAAQGYSTVSGLGKVMTGAKAAKTAGKAVNAMGGFRGLGALRF